MKRRNCQSQQTKLKVLEDNILDPSLHPSSTPALPSIDALFWRSRTRSLDTVEAADNCRGLDAKARAKNLTSIKLSIHDGSSSLLTSLVSFHPSTATPSETHNAHLSATNLTTCMQFVGLQGGRQRHPVPGAAITVPITLNTDSLCRRHRPALVSGCTA